MAQLVRLNVSGPGTGLGLALRLAASIGRKGGTALNFQTHSKWLADRATPKSEPAPRPSQALPTEMSPAIENEARPRRVLLKLGLVAALVFGGYLIGHLTAPNHAARTPDANFNEALAPTPVALAPPAPAPLAPTPLVPASLEAPSGPPTEVTEPSPASIRTARPLRRDEVRETQAWLKAFGFYPGPLDGLQGPQTKAAVKRYQAARQREETGVLDRPLLQQVRQQGGHSGR